MFVQWLLGTFVFCMTEYTFYCLFLIWSTVNTVVIIGDGLWATLLNANNVCLFGIWSKPICFHFASSFTTLRQTDKFVERSNNLMPLCWATMYMDVNGDAAGVATNLVNLYVCIKLVKMII